MAPEVSEKAYDERSDVWSLGCILLEMCTTAFFDQGKLASKLLEARNDAFALEEVYEEMDAVSVFFFFFSGEVETLTSGMSSVAGYLRYTKIQSINQSIKF